MAGINKMFIKKGNVVVMFKQVGELREAVVLTKLWMHIYRGYQKIQFKRGRQ